MSYGYPYGAGYGNTPRPGVPAGYAAYGQYAGYMAGYGGYAAAAPAQTAYNVNQYPQYAAGYPPGYPAGTAHPAYPGQQPAYAGHPAASAYQQASGAVPGFTVPAASPYYAGHGAPPPSMQYGMAQTAMANYGLQNAQWRMWQQMGLVNPDKDFHEEMEAQARRRRRNITEDDEDEGEMEEMKRKIEERARLAEEEVVRMRKRLEEDDGLKNELRETFIKELVRRQEVNGTFEETQGTVLPFQKYDEEDPVYQWFQAEKGQDISGEDWDALYDAEYLRKAVKGFGTDEAAIIALVSTRCNSQRNQIMKEYKTAYGRDLCKDLRGDLSGDFEEVVLALFETPARYDAWSIKKAIYGLGTDERTLIEILLTRTNAQIQEMVQEYDQITYAKQKNPESSLERDLDGDCSGDFKRLLISAAQGNRRLIDLEKLIEAVEEVQHDGKWTGMFQVNYEKLCNRDKCHRMAEELMAAGEDKWGTDEETFNRIFATQDFYSLRMVWDEYVKISQRDIMNTLDHETSGSYKKGLLAVAQSVKCRPMFFGERLYRSMKGAGTDDSTLIRIIVSRSEVDMVQIKQCFLDQHQKTLWSYVKKDTSGDYKKLLLSLVGKN